jgi:hypothetical protein
MSSFLERYFASCLLLVVLIAPPGLRGATDFYVATNGFDTNPGTLAQPFKTLEAARDAIRKAKKAAPLTNGATVWIRGGKYFRDSTFTLSSVDSGTVAGPIVYRAYPSEQVRLIGGRQLSGFQPVTDSNTLAHLTPSAQTNVLQADLWGQGIRNLGVLSRHGYAIDWTSGQTELFFQDHPMQLARWPNTDVGWLRIASKPAPGTNSFAYAGDRPAKWADLSDVWVHGYWGRDWADSCEKLASLDLSNKVVFITPPGSTFGYKTNFRFFFLNVLEELDSPGEYYIDRRQGILYFWPPGVITNKLAIISLADTIMTITSVSNVAFAGGTLEAAKLSLVSINGGQSNVITGCVLRGSSRNGVTILDSPGSGVAYCDISDMGETGVFMAGAGGKRITLTPGTNFVHNSKIYQVGRLSWTYKPAIYLSGVGNYISRNLIYNAPHTAVMLYGNDNVLEYNEIHHVCTETADAGAIYMGYDWTMRGNVFRYNYLHDLNAGGGAVNAAGVVGIYLDDCFSGSAIFGNIFCSVDGGLHIGGGRDNLVQNNIFVDCTNYSIAVDQRLLSWMSYELTGTNSALLTRLKAMPYQTPPWSARYPTLVNILNDEPNMAKGNIIQNNIRYGGSWLLLKDNVETVLNVTNNFTTGDPKFANYSQRNFAFLTNSPVWTLGFQPIPMSSFGPVPSGPQELELARPQ